LHYFIQLNLLKQLSINYLPNKSLIVTNNIVDGYPCYLFFNSNGEIVHKAYGKREISNFLNLLQKVPNPDFQYYTLRKKYEENKQDKTILKKLLNASMEAEPEDKQDLIKAYLSQKPAIENESRSTGHHGCNPFFPRHWLPITFESS